MNKNPEHVAGEICNAPRCSSLEPKEYDSYIFRFTGEHRKVNIAFTCFQVSSGFSPVNINHLMPRSTMSRTVEEHEAKYHAETKPNPAHKIPSWAYDGATVHWDGINVYGNMCGEPHDIILRSSNGTTERIGVQVDFKADGRWYVNIDHLSPIKPEPEPKYKAGGWVVVPFSNLPYKLIHVNGNQLILKDGTFIDITDVRPATAEDFKKEFDGVKVWMEIYGGYAYEYYQYKDGYIRNGVRLYSWQIQKNEAAGVMFMPEEYWKEK